MGKRRRTRRNEVWTDATKQEKDTFSSAGGRQSLKRTTNATLTWPDVSDPKEREAELQWILTPAVLAFLQKKKKQN